MGCACIVGEGVNIMRACVRVCVRVRVIAVIQVFVAASFVLKSYACARVHVLKKVSVCLHNSNYMGECVLL